MPQDPPAVHDELVRRFHDPTDSEVTTAWRDLPVKQYIEWPAVQDLLPDVEGHRVLDAGCGDGATIEWLLKHGADVVGIDASQESIDWAKENVQDNVGADAEFYHADLREPLAFADGGEFDLIVTQYTLGFVADVASVFAEFQRILSPHGHLVFSTEHPYREYRENDDVDSYFEPQQTPQDWGFTTIEHYYRPVSGFLNPLAEAGFALERFCEPEPQTELEQTHPELYDDKNTAPQILAVRARNTESPTSERG